ncbi:MAG: TolC family protein [candidate division WOR-3 bacterium]
MALLTGLLISLLLSGAAKPETLFLDLNQTLNLALHHSPQAAEAGTDQTQAVLTTARGIAGLLPAPGASLSGYKSGTTTTWTGEVTISQVVFNPALFSGLVSAIINSGYYSASARDRTARLILSVTTDYLNLLRARYLLAAATKAVKQAEANYQLTEERFRLGQASKIDLLRSHTFLLQAQLNQLSAEKGYAGAMSTLGASTGISTGPVIVPVEELNPDPPAIQPESVRQQVLCFNPGLKINLKLNQVATLNLISACLRALPAVSLFRRWQYQDTTFPQSVSHWQDRTVRTDGIMLSFPIADLAGFILNLGDALVARRRSRAELLKTRLELSTAVENALYGYQEAQQRYQQATTNLKLNQELYELARARFQLGALSLTELLEIETGLAQAEATAISALCDIYIQSAQLGYLMGITRAGTKQ